jgi:hypothetical protein
MERCKMLRGAVLAASVLMLVLLPSASAFASWQVDGVAVCTAAGDQYPYAIVSDGAGGAILAWIDSRSGDYDIYAQRVNASGAVQWAANGVALCTATGDQYSPTIVSDGAGGAIVTWEDLSLYVHAQRVNASGAVQWATGGVVLSKATVSQWNSRSISDGAGGAIVTWQAHGGSSNYDIYAQRVDASGAVQWTADGVVLCAATGDQEHPAIASDNAGGAIVTWDDGRGNRNIYAQRVDASGAVQWTADGVVLCAATGHQEDPAITSDGAGGAIAAWIDSRVVGTWDIYAQRVDGSGAVQWIANGMVICAAVGNQGSVAIASDGAGGAIVTWNDLRSGSGGDIYAQYVNVSGAAQWTADGVALCTAAGYQGPPSIVSDGAGGAIVTWPDPRSEDPVNYDVYAQWVSASGAVQWAADGVALCTAAGDQYPGGIVSDGAGGAIVAWEDSRGGNFDIYAQRVQGVSPVATLLASFGARVEASVVRVVWELSEPVTGLTFDVLRSSSGPGSFEEIPVAIESNGKAYSFADAKCAPGSILRYRVDVTESGARRTLFETEAVAVPAGLLALFQNAPNPFNPTTTLRYTLPAPCEATLSIYDAAGRLVVTLVDRERQEAGQHVGMWSGLDSRGRSVPSGVYFSVLTAGKERLSNKMILLR